MGVYSSFFYTKHEGDHIYYSREYMGENVEMSLYVNQKLVDRKSGGLGVYILNHDQIKLVLNLKYFKKTRVLTIGNNEVEFPQISLKKLKKILNDSGINNEVNPERTKEEQLKPRDFIFPLVTIIIGSILYVMVLGKSKYAEIPSFILFFIGFNILFNIITKQYFRHTYDNGHLRIWSILIGLLSVMMMSILLSSIF